MKRSNRLVLLVGVFLAIVAFVGILLLVRQPSGDNGPAKAPVDGPVVVATADIPLSTRIAAEQVTTKIVPLTGISAGALHQRALAAGVAFVPGPAFYADPAGDGELRLCFTSAIPATVDESIKRLARCIGEVRLTA